MSRRHRRPEASDPHYAERIRGSFARQAAMALLGARLSRIEPGLVEIELPHRADLTQQHGFVHGGIVGAIADSAGGYAGYTLFPAGSTVMTVEYKINFLAPAQGEKLIATGRVVRSGRTLTVCELTVDGVDADGERHPCAHGTQTLICLQGRADAPPAPASASHSAATAAAT
jgi:uncharacterized protein (TIGR00369 family)